MPSPLRKCRCGAIHTFNRDDIRRLAEDAGFVILPPEPDVAALQAGWQRSSVPSDNKQAYTALREQLLKAQRDQRFKVSASETR